jgi:hypothetical protein
MRRLARHIPHVVEFAVRDHPPSVDRITQHVDERLISYDVGGRMDRAGVSPLGEDVMDAPDRHDDLDRFAVGDAGVA